MMKFYSLIICFFILPSCKNHDTNSQALNLFKKASKVYTDNLQNRDSLFYVLRLIDSAIKYDKKNLNFYFIESRVYMDLKEYDNVISKCNVILSLSEGNFMAELTKGVTYDRLHNLDSSQKIYREALSSLEKTKFATKIYKDYQRVVLFGLLRDSHAFDAALKGFKRDHEGEKEFAAYYEDLENFNRDNYIASY